MTNNNHEILRRGLSLCTKGLRPFIERELKAVYGENWELQAREALRVPENMRLHWDSQATLNIIDRCWNTVFKRNMERKQRSWALETVSVRHELMHEKESFSDRETSRALDTMEWLLASVRAPEASEVNTLKNSIDHSNPTLPQSVKTLTQTSELRGRHVIENPVSKLGQESSPERDTWMSENERVLVTRRIRSWASKPHLNVHRIIGIVARASSGISRDALVREAANITRSRNAYGAVASLMTSKANAYGRVFVDVHGVIKLHPAVAREVHAFKWWPD